MNPCKQCVDACLYSVQGYHCAEGCTGCFTRKLRVREMIECAWDILGADYDGDCGPDSEWRALGGIIMPGSQVTEAGDATRKGTVASRDPEYVWVKWSDDGDPEPYQSGKHEDDDEPLWELRLVH